jgi:hypothetical protein
LIGKVFERRSLTRRILTRGIVILGAVWVGGLITRTFPHDQVLVFPVGSVFPNASHFSASWRQTGDREPRGGISLTFATPPPLQIRQHADLPNGDYLVSIEVVVTDYTTARAENTSVKDRVNPSHAQNPQNATVLPAARGLQTNIERRVTLAGGETMVALAAGGF